MTCRQLVLLLVVVLLLAPARSASADDAAEPRPAPAFGVPDDESVARALKLVKNTFAAEYAGAVNGLPQRAALAQRLLREALDTKDDRPARYVLLCEARDLATKAADAATACRAIDALAAQFGVGPGEMTLAALSNIGRVAMTPQGQESLVRCSLAAADGALSRDDYDLAGRLAAVAEGAARRLKRVALSVEAEAKVKEIAWASREYAGAKAAIETLTTDPDNTEAKSAAGRFKCLVKNDWEHGLPLLREGSDAKLKLLAARDQAAAAAGAAAQNEVAGEWWELGELHLQRARLACRTRAAHWYRQCASKLTGLPKTLAEKRLEEVDLARLREMRLAPGLAAEFFEGEFGKPLERRVDGQIDFDWPRAAGEGLPADNFSVRWTGQLRVPAAGKYGLFLYVNEGARVWVDEKLVLEEVKGSSKRKPAQATVTLTEGNHALRVEFWDGGGLAKMRLLWQPPGAASEVPIPEKAFVHEMGTGR